MMTMAEATSTYSATKSKMYCMMGSQFFPMEKSLIALSIQGWGVSISKKYQQYSMKQYVISSLKAITLSAIKSVMR